jgi:hypothetical protein
MGLRQGGQTVSESSFKRVLEAAGLTQRRKRRRASEAGRLSSGKRTPGTPGTPGALGTSGTLGTAGNVRSAGNVRNAGSAGNVRKAGSPGERRPVRRSLQSFRTTRRSRRTHGNERSRRDTMIVGWRFSACIDQKNATRPVGTFERQRYKET